MLPRRDDIFVCSVYLGYGFFNYGWPDFINLVVVVGSVQKKKVFFLLDPHRQKIINDDESPMTFLTQTHVVEALRLQLLVEEYVGYS